MKKILFLDFDGVLHADTGLAGNFSRLGHLEKYLLKMPDVEIVISSSWRETYSFDKLKAFFPLHLRDRIIGTTPVLETSFDDGGRQREIEAFLKDASLNESNSSWVALDDMQFLFDADCAQLILVDASNGFNDSHGGRLLAWYEAALER